MKKNNGSLQLWLWTLTPVFCMFWGIIFFGSPELARKVHGGWFMEFIYPRSGHLCGTLSVVSYLICGRLREGEKDSATPAALSMSKKVVVIGITLQLAVAMISILYVLYLRHIAS